MKQEDTVALNPICLEESPWQVRRYIPDPSKVMVLSPLGRWVFDAEELIDAIRSVSEIAPIHRIE